MPTAASTPDWKFLLGLVLVVVGHVLGLNIYLLVFAGPLLLLGTLLIWLSRKSVVVKTLGTLPLLLFCLFVLRHSLFPPAYATPTIFLIPASFRGEITILYEEPCGEMVPKKDGYFTYRIPRNGVLLLQNKFEEGRIYHEYYFYSDTTREVNPIKYLIQQDFNEDYRPEPNPHEPSRTTVGLFLGGSGAGVTQRNKQYTFQKMYVLSYDSLRVHRSAAHDALVDSLLANCRHKPTAHR